MLSCNKFNEIESNLFCMCVSEMDTRIVLGKITFKMFAVPTAYKICLNGH